MHPALPKVLQPLAGRPMLEHVLATARSVNPAAIHVVYGHGGDQVRAAFAGQADLKWAHQAEQLGTGHAVMQAMPAIPDDHTVLVLCGDVPLVGAAVVQKLAADSANGDLALLTAIVPDPTGYGRVLRNARGDVQRVNEINTGLLAFNAGALRRALSKLTNDNAQREYYLTDVIGLAIADGKRVRGSVAEHATDVLGIN